ncbi:hypothetical protein Q5P01_017616 [Channa striata]|uniref:Platelet-derived growth factor subunit B n=1 Tax=Channa striata TaxID=64152 RepID=A0AA88MDE1_CHASR|nr:hypothetical protein Q5P01_017616 [Channa striata]
MSSWVQLLLVVLAACLRFAGAEGDPLPAALVELVRNSPISSIEDLQLLLLTDSVDEEEETSAANGAHRLPRSLNAQPAQQALCKVRTEVVEVTRAMLDRSNANFLLWPPCVEVQRCSGCCNTKSLQCVPVVTHTRYLQVMKIEYINKRPTYAKAVVSVVDHVECRCQTAPAPKKKPPRRQHGHQHRNQTLSQGHGHGQVKVHSKDELHQWDELKHNQRTQLEELLDQHWNPRGDTFTEAGEGFSLPGENPSPPGEAVLFAPHWAYNSTRLHGTDQQIELPESVERKAGGISEGNKTISSEDKVVEGGDGLPLNSTEERLNAGSRDSDGGTLTQIKEDKSKISTSHRSGVSQAVTQKPQDKFSRAEETIDERAGSRFRPTKEPNPDPRGQARNNETPELKRILDMEEARLEEERKELLLLHKRLDQEKELLKHQQMQREEEERKKEKEADGGRHLHHHHHRHHQQTTTHKPETTTPTTTTRQPSAPSGPRPPARVAYTQGHKVKSRGAAERLPSFKVFIHLLLTRSSCEIPSVTLLMTVW